MAGPWQQDSHERCQSAVAQAAISCTGRNTDDWKTALHDDWKAAVQETVEAYFKDARRSFEKEEYLEERRPWPTP